MAKASKVRGRKGKLGKNKARIVVYYSNGCWHWNKARRIMKHIARYGGESGQSDSTATKALAVLRASMPLHLSRKLAA